MAERSNPSELIESIIGDYFGANKKPETERQPGQEQSGGGGAMAGVSQVIGAAVGGFFGGPLGAQAGATAGKFVGEQASKASSVPQGPGATISSGTVDVKSGGEQAGQAADHLQQLAMRGIQTRIAPHGRGKVF